MAQVIGDDGTHSGIDVGTNFGVHGDTKSGIGVVGSSGKGGLGVQGIGDVGVEAVGHYFGEGSFSLGLIAYSQKEGGLGIISSANNGVGVSGIDIGNGTGLSGASHNIGIFAQNMENRDNIAYLGTRCCAGEFHGGVAVFGDLTLVGGKLNHQSALIRIDHLLDPANKYLSHSIVESPDMKNIYDGVVVIDAKGNAVVELPAWFDALNKDFRYQLTPIGAAGPNLHIEVEISNNRFKIAGGTPGMKVSWMVTGIRKDPWSNAHRIQVEEEKPANERGYYLNPELYNQPKDKSIERVKYTVQTKQAQDIEKEAASMAKKAGKQEK